MQVVVHTYHENHSGSRIFQPVPSNPLHQKTSTLGPVGSNECSRLAASVFQPVLHYHQRALQPINFLTESHHCSPAAIRAPQKSNLKKLNPGSGHALLSLEQSHKHHVHWDDCLTQTRIIPSNEQAFKDQYQGSDDLSGPQSFPSSPPEYNMQGLEVLYSPTCPASYTFPAQKSANGSTSFPAALLDSLDTIPSTSPSPSGPSPQIIKKAFHSSTGHLPPNLNSRKKALANHASNMVPLVAFTQHPVPAQDIGLDAIMRSNLAQLAHRHRAFQEYWGQAREEVSKQIQPSITFTKSLFPTSGTHDTHHGATNQPASPVTDASNGMAVDQPLPRGDVGSASPDLLDKGYNRWSSPAPLVLHSLPGTFAQNNTPEKHNGVEDMGADSQLDIGRRVAENSLEDVKHIGLIRSGGLPWMDSGSSPTQDSLGIEVNRENKRDTPKASTPGAQGTERCRVVEIGEIVDVDVEMMKMDTREEGEIIEVGMELEEGELFDEARNSRIGFTADGQPRVLIPQEKSETRASLFDITPEPEDRRAQEGLGTVDTLVAGIDDTFCMVEETKEKITRPTITDVQYRSTPSDNNMAHLPTCIARKFKNLTKKTLSSWASSLSLLLDMDERRGFEKERCNHLEYLLRTVDMNKNHPELTLDLVRGSNLYSAIHRLAIRSPPRVHRNLEEMAMNIDKCWEYRFRP
ncbi:hypothetical protein BD779DRAFT_1489803 [Infundibulicybe gibba]|nr:hypothetical protein BD779DRAFT_1489803 [Infundibulicybe gibba]